MALHLHPAILPLTALATLGYLLFRSKSARASVSEANANLSAFPGAAAQLPAPSTTNVNSADYISHLQNAVKNSAVIHSDLTAQAQAGLIPLDAAGHTILKADSDLRQPMDTLTVQRDLNVLGATPALKEDGTMGPKTTQALKDFQKKMLVDQTGQLNEDTSRALRLAVAAVLGSSSNVATSGIWSDFVDALGLSSSGMSVREIQQALNATGTAHLAVDGVMGPLTIGAIKTFQAGNGLAADGKVGPETVSALRYFTAAVNPHLQQYVDITKTAGGYYDAQMYYGGMYGAPYGVAGGETQVAGYGYPVAGYSPSGNNW